VTYLLFFLAVVLAESVAHDFAAAAAAAAFYVRGEEDQALHDAAFGTWS
jgi:hypothetical protein